MTFPSVPEANPTGGGVHARRCARHSFREAAARCPECREFFCRECIVEHDGRLLCAPCLARVVGRETRRREVRSRVRRAGLVFVGALLMWSMFQSMGVLLLRIPPDFHEGTVWKKFQLHAGP